MDELLATRPYHGGRIGEARRRWPAAPSPFLDLSTGINPCPYPLPPLAADLFMRLPEPEAEAALLDVAAARYGIGDPAMVAAAPGTQILIGLLPVLFPKARVAVLGPTYAEHASCWAAAGSVVREVRDPLELAGADAAVVCVPNNPDGRVLDAGMLRWIADRVGLLVIDAAFADLEDGPDPTEALPHSRIIVLRSFGKTYGLAGVRLGFALADPARAAVIRRTLGPWAVSGPALAAGTAALANSAWLAEAANTLKAASARLDDLLRESGLEIIGGTRLFRLAATPDAAARFEALGRAGILVRRFEQAPTWLRFGLPSAGWNRLAAALSVRA